MGRLWLVAGISERERNQSLGSSCRRLSVHPHCGPRVLVIGLFERLIIDRLCIHHNGSTRGLLSFSCSHEDHGAALTLQEMSLPLSEVGRSKQHEAGEIIAHVNATDFSHSCTCLCQHPPVTVRIECRAPTRKILQRGSCRRADT